MTQVIPDTAAVVGGPEVSTGNEVADYGDSGLMICIGRRRRSALAEVYRRHGGTMHTLAAQVCGTELGEDVVRDVMVALWRDPEAFDAGRSSLRGFLLAQAHARAVEAVRTDAAGRSRTSARVDRGAGVDRAALAGHVGEHAWSVLSALPEHECNAIALAYFCGYSCAELADLVGQPRQIATGQVRSGLVGLGARSSQPDSAR